MTPEGAVLRSNKRLSRGEEAFALHCRVEKLEPVREYRFCPERKWRVDFCFVAERLAIEIEGGIWTAGRHSRGSGMIADIAKYNTLSKMGYRLLRYTTQMVESGQAIEEVLEALKGEAA